MKQQHLHWSYALGFLHRMLVLAIVPLLPVIARWDLAGLGLALRQEAVLLVFLVLAGTVIVMATSWQLDEDLTLRLRWDLFFHISRSISASQLAAVKVERSVLQRLLGAATVTLYPSAAASHRTLQFLLSRRQAEALAAQLLPQKQAEAELYRPDWGERLVFALLSTNNAASLFAIVLATQRAFREGLLNDAIQELTFEHLNRAAAWVSRWVPPGAAWLLTLLGVWALLCLCRSLLHTILYRVRFTDDILDAEYGVLHLTRCRVRIAAITSADIRLTPVARLLHRYPVYITAGSYTDSEIPLYVSRRGIDAALAHILPQLRLPPHARVPIKGRSLAPLMPAAALLALFVLLDLLSASYVPELLPILVLFSLYYFAMTLFAIEGFFREGAWFTDGRLTLRVQRRFTMHCVCCLSPMLALQVSQHPWATARRRAHLTAALPGRLRYKVRSIPLADAEACVQGVLKGVKVS